MFKSLSQADRRPLVLAACSLIFLANFLLGNDFGKFRPDYFEAHGLSMRHLHQPGPWTELLRTIPNSASGVLPLWLYGFVDGLVAHKIVSLAVFLGLLGLVFAKRRFSEFSFALACSLLLSPMLASATSWVLPEVFALLLTWIVFALPARLAPLSVALSALVPWARQTFITHLGNRLLYLSGGLKRYAAELIAATIGLFVLYRIWGGLVPPNLVKVHVTPGVKPVTIAILVFSLYFLYDNIRSLRTLRPRGWRIPLSAGAAAILVAVNLNAAPLLGGGYLFSRLERWNGAAAGVIEFGAYFLFFLATDIRLICWTLISSLSFATTNYFFLKYADFYVFAFLGYGLTELSPKLKAAFDRYARSVLVFQCASLALAYAFYMGMR